MTTQSIEKLQNFIGGKWVDTQSTQTEDVYNPATGEVIAQVPISTTEELDEAVQIAKNAFQTWKDEPVPKRARILFKYQQLLVDHWDELARLITIENGKNFDEAHGEVLRGIECVEFAAGAPNLMMGEQLHS